MKLSNKILYCRKKAGLSQEALADILGVSRQAVSKWETGEATPEISKLSLLAAAFNVSTDWLLSDSEPEQDKAASQAQTVEQDESNKTPSWVDSIPGLIGRLIRRYGWLYGVYTAIAGAGFALIGFLARAMTKQMFTMEPFSMTGGFGESFASNNPVATMGTVIMVIGIVMMVAGVILAVVLKRRSGK